MFLTPVCFSHVRTENVWNPQIYVDGYTGVEAKHHTTFGFVVKVSKKKRIEKQGFTVAAQAALASDAFSIKEGVKKHCMNFFDMEIDGRAAIEKEVNIRIKMKYLAPLDYKIAADYFYPGSKKRGPPPNPIQAIKYCLEMSKSHKYGESFAKDLADVISELDDAINDSELDLVLKGQLAKQLLEIQATRITKIPEVGSKKKVIRAYNEANVRIIVKRYHALLIVDQFRKILDGTYLYLPIELGTRDKPQLWAKPPTHQDYEICIGMQRAHNMAQVQKRHLHGHYIVSNEKSVC